MRSSSAELTRGESAGPSCVGRSHGVLFVSSVWALYVHRPVWCVGFLGVRGAVCVCVCVCVCGLRTEGLFSVCVCSVGKKWTSEEWGDVCSVRTHRGTVSCVYSVLYTE